MAAKYFKKYSDRYRKGCMYPRTESPDDLAIGKYRFLKGIGVGLERVDGY